MAIGVGAKSGGCRQMTRAPSPWSWPARPHERAPGACSAAAAGALRIRNGRAPQTVRPVTRLNRTRRHPQRPPAAHQRPAPATPPRGVSMELERPFDATVGSRPTTTCNKSGDEVRRARLAHIGPRPHGAGRDRDAADRDGRPARGLALICTCPTPRRSCAADHMWFIDIAYMRLQHPLRPVSG